jgi:cobalt-zinc-cadmium efflux system outer membrane protein
MRNGYFIISIIASVVFSSIAHCEEDNYPRAISFEQATEIAIKSNLELVAAKYNISSAEADELTAGLWANPSLTADTVFQPFSGNWNQTNTGGPRQYDLGLSIPIDLSGKISAATKSANAAKQIAEASFRDAVRLKVLQVRLAYVDLLAASNQYSLSQERQESMTRLVSMIENRIGNKGRLPLLQRRARLALDQAVLDSRQRAASLKIAKMTLAVALSRAPSDASVDATSKLRDFKMIALPPVDKFEEQAFASRPDLEALRLSSSKADLDGDLARSQVWDNFILAATVTHQGASSPNPSDPGSQSLPGAYSWGAALTIPLPVFNRNQGGIQKAGVIRNQADKQIQSLVLSIRQEIASDYEQFLLNESLIKDYESTQLKRAREVRDSQQTLFGTGGSALLDYFDAVNAYQTSLSSYYDIVAEYRRGLARLNAAAGKDVL